MVYENRFQGRTAIVTGGASGIGLSVAARLAREGAAVSLWDLKEDALAWAKAEAHATDTQALDVADPAQVLRAMSASVALGGKLDVLVASAGITGPNTPVRDYPVEAWRQVIDVNLNGLFYCIRPPCRTWSATATAASSTSPPSPARRATRTLLPTARQGRGHRIHQVARQGDGRHRDPGELRHPAAVRTAIFDQMSQQHIDFMLSRIPIGRFGTIEEVTSLVCWLASEECSFSTGAVFDVSGGRATY